MPSFPRQAAAFLVSTVVFLSAGAVPGTEAPPATTPTVEAGTDGVSAAPAISRPDPATEKFWQAVKLLRAGSPADLAAGRAALQAASDLELSHAQILLAGCYFSGANGFPKDARKGANLVRLAAERGNGFAMVSIGCCYALGEGVRKNEAKSMTWLKAALQPEADFTQLVPPVEMPELSRNDEDAVGVAGGLVVDQVASTKAGAHFVLAALHARHKESVEAQAHYVAAATAGTDGRSGYFPAALQAAINYAFGQGIPRDLEKANAMLEQGNKIRTRVAMSIIHTSVVLKRVDEFAAADLENALAEGAPSFESDIQFAIARTMADKKDKNYNVKESAKWYELAADNGQSWAMLRLAEMCYHGELGPSDPGRAFKYYKLAGGGDHPKHLLGVANLAICYENGIGTAKSPAEAAALFKKYREGDIVCYLGSIGQCPKTPLTLEQEVALNQAWAKQHKDPHAQYLLALRFIYGIGLRIDGYEGRTWLKKAAKSRHPAALYMLGRFAEVAAELAFDDEEKNKETKTALDYYRQASAAGSAEGTVSYATMIHAGRGAPQDLALAETLYLKCLQQDPTLPRADNNLGLIYEEKLTHALEANKPEVMTLRATMLSHYTASGKREYAEALGHLGSLYYQGQLVDRDFRKAYTYFEQAASLGLPSAHFGLGVMNEEGDGVPVTYTEAAYHYRLAALEGHTEALRRLINFYLTGQGVSLDLDRASFWLAKMVESGNKHVLTTYCDVLLSKGNYEQAMKLLTVLTEGFTDPVLAGYGCERMARCYEQGLGVKANAAKGRKYRERALKLDNGDAWAKLGMQQFDEGKVVDGLASLRRAAPNSRQANYALGVIFFYGNKVLKNEAVGLRHLHVAAELNHPDALYLLATLAYDHKAGAPSLDEAIHFARQAEANGHAKAGALRDQLERQRKGDNVIADDSPRTRSS